MNLPHSLYRVITIHAPREVVFSFFTDNAKWASWWGTGSTIDPQVGGRVYIRHPGNVESSGNVLEIQRPSRLVFTYGFDSGKPIPPGASRVSIALEAVGHSTRLEVKHHFDNVAVRDEHVQGWRYQLALFSNAVLNLIHADAESKVDAWFRAWAESSDDARKAALVSLVASSISFRDRYSATDGIDDLSAHIAATHKFMRGVRLERRGAIRHCQGTTLADWVAMAADGKEIGKGTNVFQLGGDGKIEAVTGLWG
jgi:uncharacterized protein YndB with AHSA1/START domain